MKTLYYTEGMSPTLILPNATSTSSTPVNSTLVDQKPNIYPCKNPHSCLTLPLQMFQPWASCLQMPLDAFIALRMLKMLFHLDL